VIFALKNFTQMHLKRQIFESMTFFRVFLAKLWLLKVTIQEEVDVDNIPTSVVHGMKSLSWRWAKLEGRSLFLVFFCAVYSFSSSGSKPWFEKLQKICFGCVV
jgi:hypothetical protein